MPNLYQISSVPAFQDALKAVLQTRPNLSGVSISIGPPAPGIAQESKWISLLEVTGQEAWAAMGRLSVEETYNQKVCISVVARDGESDAVNTRNIAYNLRSEIAEQLRIDATIGGAVWQAQIRGKVEFFPRLGIQSADATDYNKMVTDMSYREACLYFDIFVRNRMLHN